jgi:hypothetical protein
VPDFTYLIAAANAACYFFHGQLDSPTLPIPARLIRRRLMIAHQMSARRYLSGTISRACQYVTAVTLTLSKLRDQTNLAR